MEAEQVWTLWRRLLRDEALQQQLFQAHGATEWLQGFPEHERAILAAYASEFDRVKWFVENYQFRLVNSFINALETGAPLTLRALLNLELDLAELSKEFLREQAWFDYGPQVYTYCDAALDFLLRHSELQGLPQVQDLIRLERQCVALYRGLVTPTPIEPGHYQRSSNARLYRSSRALSGWLRDKRQLGRGDLAEACEHILVYLPQPQARHKFTLLSPRAAELYGFLERPRLPADFAQRPASNDDLQLSHTDLAVLGKLQQFNAIRIPE